MLKGYIVRTVVGDYKTLALSVMHAKIRAYKEYKQTRNTNYGKFENKIIQVERII